MLVTSVSPVLSTLYGGCVTSKNPYSKDFSAVAQALAVTLGTKTSAAQKRNSNPNNVLEESMVRRKRTRKTKGGANEPERKNQQKEQTRVEL